MRSEIAARLETNTSAALPTQRAAQARATRAASRLDTRVPWLRSTAFRHQETGLGNRARGRFSLERNTTDAPIPRATRVRAVWVAPQLITNVP